MPPADQLEQVPEEIDLADAAHVAWVKSQRDPALWHQAAMAALAYRGDDYDFLPGFSNSRRWTAQPPAGFFYGQKVRASCVAKPTFL